MGTVTPISNTREQWPSHPGGPPFRIVDLGQRACPRCDCKLTRIDDEGWHNCPCVCHDSARAILTPMWRR